jgi:hypothetical protein
MQRSAPCPSIGSKWFWTIQIVLDGYKLVKLGPNHFGQVQIILFWTNSIIWIVPKRLVLDQNYLDNPKSFWTQRRTKHKMTYDYDCSKSLQKLQKTNKSPPWNPNIKCNLMCIDHDQKRPLRCRNWMISHASTTDIHVNGLPQGRSKWKNCRL